MRTFSGKIKEWRSRYRERLLFMNLVFEGKKTGEFATEDRVRRKKIFSHYIYNFVFSLMTAFTLTQAEPEQFQFFVPKAGEVAEADFISPLSAEMEPLTLSKSQATEIERNMPPVFDYDDMEIESWLRRWELAFRKVRQEFYANGRNTKRKEVPEQLGARVRNLTEQTLSARHLQFLHQQRFSENVENTFTEVGRLLLGRLISPSNLFPTYYNTGIQIRLINQGMRETVIHDVSRVWSVEQAREYLARIPGAPSGQNTAIFAEVVELVSALVIPNLKYNEGVSKQRSVRTLRTNKGRPVVLKRGQIIVQKGERVTEEQAEILKRLADYLSRGSSTKRFFLSLVLIFVFFSVLFRLNITGRAFWNLSLKDALVFMMITLVAFTSVRFALPYLKQLFAPLQLGFGAEYLLPISAGGIIVHLTMGKEIAFTYATLTSIVVGYLLEQNFYFTVYSFAVTAAAIQSIRSCRLRNDLYRAGAWSGLVGALLVVCFSLTQLVGFKLQNWNTVGISVAMAFASGMLSAVLTSTLIPIFETVFGYTTSLKLLELSNFNHPLLHNLMMKAPGTYHHSVIVGSLAELAADRVKANSLLARVASYYHDIGKMNKPLYFIENQSPHSNPHDHLQPSMSAKILFAHVKTGVRMGKEHKLGAPIVNIIEQHHGTTLVSYFFNKAKKQENPEMDVVMEAQFRYPGPRPQSREAAIVMLADACEAATRSIAEPTAAKIQTMVHNIITKRLLEDQFSECELTLKDLAIIEDCFVRTLVSLYHHRIEYPGQAQATTPANPAAPTVPGAPPKKTHNHSH